MGENELGRTIKELIEEKHKLQADLEYRRKQVRNLTKQVELLKRQINCIKNHPEIKPVHCCWTGDSLLMQEYEKELKLRK